MRGVWIHGALLLVVIGLAYPSWTRERANPNAIVGSLVWDRDTTALSSVSYRSARRQIEISRRVENAEAFLWGQEVASEVGPTSADTLRFPVGVLGSVLVKGFSEFRVAREFGQINSDQEQSFGLGTPSAVITLEFTDGPEVIEVGAPVFGGSDRYGWNPSTRIAFVVPSQLVDPLESGYGAIRERQLHHFQSTDVARVTVQALGREREMERSEGGPGAPEIWAPASQPQRPDLTFANFMERVDQLAIEGFESPVLRRELESILRVDYSDDKGAPLGFVELMKHIESGTYYVLSERTRVAAEAIALLAERVEQDLTQIF